MMRIIKSISDTFISALVKIVHTLGNIEPDSSIKDYYGNDIPLSTNSSLEEQEKYDKEVLKKDFDQITKRKWLKEKK